MDQRRRTISHFDANSGKLLRTTELADVVNEKGATRYWFSQDGKWLCTTEVYCHVTVWDTDTGVRRLRMKMSNLSPYYAPVSSDGVLTLWDNRFIERYDVASGERLSLAKIHHRYERPISNPEGTVMAAYSEKDEAIVFFDPATGERVGGEVPTEERSWRPQDAAISADGHRFVYWIKDGKRQRNRVESVFDIETGELVKRREPPSVPFLEQPVISPDGQHFFYVGMRTVFSPIETATGKPVREVPDHVTSIQSLCFTADGKTLIVNSGEKLQAWDVETGAPGRVFEQFTYNNALHIAGLDDGTVLVSSPGEKGLRLVDPQSGNVLRHYEKGDGQNLWDFQLASDRKHFVGIIYTREGRIVRRWNVATGETIKERLLPKPPGRQDGYRHYVRRRLILGGSRIYWLDPVDPVRKLPNGTIDWGRTDMVLDDWVWLRPRERVRLPASELRCMAESFRGRKTLAVVASDHWRTKSPGKPYTGSTYLMVWDVADGRAVFQVKRKRDGFFSAFSCVALTFDGRLVASVSHENRIELWHGITGQLLQRFEAGAAIRVLAFSPDCSVLASGHEDGNVLLWDCKAAWEAGTK